MQSKNGVIAGIGHYDGVEELDMQGKIVAPGLIDAHIHLESSLVAPSEFVKLFCLMALQR